MQKRPQVSGLFSFGSASKTDIFYLAIKTKTPMATKFEHLLILSAILMGILSFKQANNKETFTTNEGDLNITLLGHASLLLQFNGKNIYIDPCKAFTKEAPPLKADAIIITHSHFDHFDAKEIERLSTKNTIIVAPEQYSNIKPAIMLKNGQKKIILGINVEAVPAYNIKHKTDNGTLFHPKGEGNGYVLTIGNKKFYVAGDTEDVPEMANLKEIDVAFLPLNLPYTMDINMFDSTVKIINPKIVFPYHYKGSDLNALKSKLETYKKIDVRIRNIY